MPTKKEEFSQTSGLRLKSVLAANGITQKELAAQLGYTEQHISQIIRGKRRLTPEMANRISGVFCCRAEWLMGHDDHKTEFDFRTAQLRDHLSKRDIFFLLAEIAGYQKNELWSLSYDDVRKLGDKLADYVALELKYKTGIVHTPKEDSEEVKKWDQMVRDQQKIYDSLNPHKGGGDRSG